MTLLTVVSKNSRPTPKRPEINEHTTKLIVGFIALMLPILTSIYSEKPLDSISASYHEIGWSRDIFVGFLFAISAFLLSYNGKEPFMRTQMMMSKVGAIAALVVAIFPCKCTDHIEIIPYLHGIASAVMFLILTIFCIFFLFRAKDKSGLHPKLRITIYVGCAIIMSAAIVFVTIDLMTNGVISSGMDRFLYIAESSALYAFGLAWLTASQKLWILASGN